MDRGCVILTSLCGLLLVFVNIIKQDVNPALAQFVSVYTVIYAVAMSLLAFLRTVGVAPGADRLPSPYEVVYSTAACFLALLAGILIGSALFGSPLASASIAPILAAVTANTTSNVRYVLVTPLGAVVLAPEQVLLPMLVLVVATAETLLFHIVVPQIVASIAPDPNIGIAFAAAASNSIFAALHFRSWRALAAPNPFTVLYGAFLAGTLMTITYLMLAQRGVAAGTGAILAHYIYDILALIHYW